MPTWLRNCLPGCAISCPAVQFPARRCNLPGCAISCLNLHLAVYLKICLPIWTPACLCVHLSALLHTLLANLYICLPSCTAVCSLPCTSVPRSAEYICLPAWLWNWPPGCAIACLAWNPPARLLTCLPGCAPTYLPLPGCTTACQASHLNAWLPDCAIASWLWNCQLGF
jgi:hypothetical protein